MGMDDSEGSAGRMMTKIGKYEIRDVLGKGAMGVVYRALDPDIDREVAIKAIHYDGVRDPSEREDLIRRFVREGRAAGKLNHPNIVTIYDVGREGDLAYIVMQYVHAQSLQRILDSGRAFEPAEADKLMLPLLRAVDYAHGKGVIHRDIKPGNVLVDTAGVPYLVDFGVAKTAASTLTLDGVAMGTPGYISPEQLQGQAADKRSDIFSLGVLFYVLLTGQEPFAGKKIATVMHKIVHDEAPPPSSLKPDLPAGYDTVAGRAMSKKPQDRYQSCAEMASALQALDRGSASTLTVRLDSETDRKRKGRRRVRALAASFAVLILAAAAAAVFIFHVFENREPNRLENLKPPAPEASSTTLAGSSQATPDPIAVKITSIRETFERGAFSETVRLANEVLAKDPSQKEARDYLDRAGTKIKDTEAADLLTHARSLYKNRDYNSCLSVLEKVLVSDPANAEAIRIRGQVETATASSAVGRVLERQRRAEEEKDLVVLLSDVAVPEEAALRKEEALLLFNYYDEIKSMISNVSYRFPVKDRARVQFLHVVTGVYKKTGEKKVLVQDVQTWTFEKRGTEWKIVGFHGDAPREAP